MTNLYFTDADTTTDTTDDEEIYHHTDHTVQMDFINAVASGFDSVQWMGLLFG